MLRLLKNKLIIIFSLMFIAGFIIGYDYAVITSRGPAAASVKGPVAPSGTANSTDGTSIGEAISIPPESGDTAEEGAPDERKITGW